MIGWRELMLKVCWEYYVDNSFQVDVEIKEARQKIGIRWLRRWENFTDILWIEKIKLTDLEWEYYFRHCNKTLSGKKKENAAQCKKNESDLDTLKEKVNNFVHNMMVVRSLQQKMMFMSKVSPSGPRERRPKLWFIYSLFE